MAAPLVSLAAHLSPANHMLKLCSSTRSTRLIAGSCEFSHQSKAGPVKARQQTVAKPNEADILRLRDNANMNLDIMPGTSWYV